MSFRGVYMIIYEGKTNHHVQIMFSDTLPLQTFQQSRMCSTILQKQILYQDNPAYFLRNVDSSRHLNYLDKSFTNESFDSQSFVLQTGSSL